MCVGGGDEYVLVCVCCICMLLCMRTQVCAGVCGHADVFRDANLMAGGISSHSVALILYIETGP